MDSEGSGFRRLTGLLLAVNLGVLVVGLGFDFWPESKETVLEFNADKVRLSGHTEAAVTGRHIPPTTAATVTTDSTTCLSWPGGLNAEQFGVLESHLKGLGLRVGDYEFRLAQRLGWWVFLPPLGSQDAVRAAMDEARRLGITDMAAVRDGSMVHALSLGAFPDMEKARAHAAMLTGKGLRGVRFGPRPGAGEVRMVWTGQAPASLSPDMTWPSGLQPEICELEKT